MSSNATSAPARARTKLERCSIRRDADRTESPLIAQLAATLEHLRTAGDPERVGTLQDQVTSYNNRPSRRFIIPIRKRVTPDQVRTWIAENLDAIQEEVDRIREAHDIES